MENCKEIPESSTLKEIDWMIEAQKIVAQCWCDERVSDRVMDPVFAQMVAEKIAFWIDTAAQNQRNTEYYRDLVITCGKMLGHDAYVCDDGSVSKDVLCAKVPELVHTLTLHAIRLEAMREGCVGMQRIMNELETNKETS